VGGGAKVLRLFLPGQPRKEKNSSAFFSTRPGGQKGKKKGESNSREKALTPRSPSYLSIRERKRGEKRSILHHIVRGKIYTGRPRTRKALSLRSTLCRKSRPGLSGQKVSQSKKVPCTESQGDRRDSSVSCGPPRKKMRHTPCCRRRGKEDRVEGRETLRLEKEKAESRRASLPSSALRSLGGRRLTVFYHRPPGRRKREGQQAAGPRTRNEAVLFVLFAAGEKVQPRALCHARGKKKKGKSVR